MRPIHVLCIAAMSAGCATVEPGHRGLIFDPFHGGLQHDVLDPGTYRLPAFGRMVDFDVTYSTTKEELRTTSAEGLVLELRMEIRFRPVVSQLYELDTEVGANYYDEVIGPEFRSAVRGVFANHSYKELLARNEKIEDEIESDVRRRVEGKHLEITSVTMESVMYAPEIGATIRDKLVAEQDASTKKQKMETQLLEKQKEREIAEQQAALDKTRAEADAVVRVTKARSLAEEMKLVADGRAAQARAERATLTPLAVIDHAYEALGKLGGTGTLMMLGDWSHVPSFLLPSLPAFQHALAGTEGTSLLPGVHPTGHAQSR